jgi:2,3-bisphosphoglycerate-dependent phosphoglycerate mutase
MYQIVLIRHGQSEWNAKNLFTGWTDVDITEKGANEARTAGKRLKENGFSFDLAFTSFQKRAIKTLHLALEELEQLWIPVNKSWRLNERHYGALQGFNKAEKAKEVGEEQVHIWRRSFDVAPPPLDLEDERHPRFDGRYKDLKPEELPATESLKDTIKRVLPYFENEIVPEIKAGKKIIISAHGNSLRSLVKHLDNISDAEITGVNIPTGVPLIYELDENMKALSSRYLETS